MGEDMRELLLFGLMFIAVLAVIGLMVGYSKFLDWNKQRRSTVKSSRIVMSRPMDEVKNNPPSALGTDSGQASDGQPPRPMKSEELLTVYRLMRKYNIPREEARAALKGANLPLGNDVWTDAAPPPVEPVEKAPISGRPLPPSAKFHEDEPGLQYRPLT